LLKDLSFEVDVMSDPPGPKSVVEHSFLGLCVPPVIEFIDPAVLDLAPAVLIKAEVHLSQLVVICHVYVDHFREINLHVLKFDFEVLQKIRFVNLKKLLCF
jgi:hypothetical protein